MRGHIGDVKYIAFSSFNTYILPTTIIRLIQNELIDNIREYDFWPEERNNS